MITLLRRRPTSHAVLEVLAGEPQAQHYGYDLMKKAGLKSGTLYPILTRFERLGIVMSEWESFDPAVADRAPRRVYTLTAEGLDFARKEIALAASTGGLRHA